MLNFFFATIVEKLYVISQRNVSTDSNRDILIYLIMLCDIGFHFTYIHRPIFFFWILLFHHIWRNLLLAKRNILYFQIWIHASFLNSSFHIFRFIQRAEFLLNSFTLLR